MIDYPAPVSDSRGVALCDACGLPCEGPDVDNYATDATVCGGTDGPGFFVCNRADCVIPDDIDERRALYECGRIMNAAKAKAARDAIAKSERPRFVVVYEDGFELTVRDFKSEERARAEYETFRGYLTSNGYGKLTLARVIEETNGPRESVLASEDQ